MNDTILLMSLAVFALPLAGVVGSYIGVALAMWLEQFEDTEQ